jgi:hypothetical protein
MFGLHKLLPLEALEVTNDQCSERTVKFFLQLAQGLVETSVGSGGSSGGDGGGAGDITKSWLQAAYESLDVNLNGVIGPDDFDLKERRDMLRATLPPPPAFDMDEAPPPLRLKAQLSVFDKGSASLGHASIDVETLVISLAMK